MEHNPQEQLLKAYTEYSDAIFRHCYFRLYQDREKALDIMQETFTKTWLYLAQGNTIEHMRAFLYRVAQNLIVDEMRKQHPVSLDALHEEGFDPPGDDARHIERIAEFGQLGKILEKLEPAYRDVVTLRYLDDLDPKEIARITGESENAVSVRIHRGIKKIQQLLS